MKRLAIVLALAAPAVAMAQVPSPSPAVTAMWNELQAVSWGVPYATWQRAHREAACEAYVAPADEVIDNGIGGVEWWSDRCRWAQPPNRAEWFFYALSPGAPVARLEQFRASVEDDSPSLEELAAVHRGLSNRLSGRYEELLRLSGTTDEAAYARQALPRLKRGIDTGQRLLLRLRLTRSLTEPRAV